MKGTAASQDVVSVGEWLSECCIVLGCCWPNGRRRGESDDCARVCAVSPDSVISCIMNECAKTCHQHHHHHQLISCCQREMWPFLSPNVKLIEIGRIFWKKGKRNSKMEFPVSQNTATVDICQVKRNPLTSDVCRCKQTVVFISKPLYSLLLLFPWSHKN